MLIIMGGPTILGPSLKNNFWKILYAHYPRNLLKNILN
jgi:hypothetical protein